MKLTEEGIKELLQRQPRATSRPADCLTEQQFMQAATGEIDARERREVASHMAVCSDCASAYQALLQLEPWAEEAGRALAPSVSCGRGARRGFSDSIAAFWQHLIWDHRVRAIAATVLIILVGGSLLVWQSVRQRTPPGSIGRAPVLPRLNVLPPDRAVIDEPPETLSWSPLEGTTAYQVVIFDFQSSIVWQSARLRESSVRLPEPVRQRLQRNQSYYWRVIAEDAIEQRQSELFQFTVVAGERR